MEDAANSAVSPKPSRKKEKMIRVRSLRRYCIGIDDPVADAMSGLDQGLAEGLVDGGAQAMDVHTQAVGVRQFLAPHAGFQLVAGHHRGRGLHQRLQELERGRRELERLPGAADL